MSRKAKLKTVSWKEIRADWMRAPALRAESPFFPAGISRRPAATPAGAVLAVFALARCAEHDHQ